MRRQFDGQLLLDVRGVALLLGTSERSVRARIGRKLLPYRKLSGRIVFLRSELEAFIADLPGVSVDEAKENLAIRSGGMVRPW
jgi:hypothetical protein